MYSLRLANQLLFRHVFLCYLSCTAPKQLPSVPLVLFFSMFGSSKMFRPHSGRRWVISWLASLSSHRKPDIDFLSVGNVLPVVNTKTVCAVVITYAHCICVVVLQRLTFQHLHFSADREDQSILCT